MSINTTYSHNLSELPAALDSGLINIGLEVSKPDLSKRIKIQFKEHLHAVVLEA